MVSPKWPYNVYNIEGKILLKAKQRITKYLVQKIVKTKHIQIKKVNLSKTTIINDLITLFDKDTYRTFFSNCESTLQVLNIIDQIEFTEPIINELISMKQTLPLTYNHILIVSALSIKVSLEFKDPHFDIYKIARIGLVHDIGKSRIPKKVLEKKTPLTDYEFKIIQEHPLIDYLLISHYLNNSRSIIAKASFAHHERSDGSGYPCGVKRLNKYVQTIIPCDIFHALISPRPYRSSPFTVRAALDLLLEESKKGKINMNFVKCLISLARKDKPHYQEVKISKPGRDAPPKINYYGIRKK
ncbi:MAG: HD domain-containing phosphohydrolase [Candidatus Omnitrophota bacterium]